MKRISIFLMLNFVFFTNAQQSELINIIWSLEKVNINNIYYHFPSSEQASPEGKIIFYNNYLNSNICNSLSADILYEENKISVLGSGLTLGSCPSGYSEYDHFENLYFGMFFGSNTGNGIYRSYTFSINDSNDGKFLILTNTLGDKAFYRAKNLAVIENSIKTLALSPNPAKDKFSISTKDKIEQIKIYSQCEQLLITSQSKTVNISSLPKGIYFINIKTDKESSLQKLIKE